MSSNSKGESGGEMAKTKRIKLGASRDLNGAEMSKNSGDGEATGSRNRHGEFKDVLLTIFEHMSVQQLKICRLVSRQWNEEACRAMRKQSVTYLSNCKTRGTENLYPDFLSVLQNRSPRLPLPFKHFYVHLRNPNKKDVETMETILRRCDAIITKLKVEGNARRNVDFGVYGPNLTELICLDRTNDFACPTDQTDFPMLESLTLAVDNVQKSSLTDLISNAPKIKGVTLTCVGRPAFIDKQFLCKFMALPNFERIDSFTIKYFIASINLADLDVLNAFQNLRSIVLQCHPGLQNQDLARKQLACLSKCSETIEHLDIGDIDINRSVAVAEFPFCPRLQSLRMNELNGLYQSIGPQRFPSLKTIVFYTCEVSELNNCGSHEGVDTIKIFGRKTESPPSAMEMVLLQKLFPNCKHLDVSNTFAEGYCKTVSRSQPTVIGWNLHTLTMACNAQSVTNPHYPYKLLQTLTGLSKETFEYAMCLDLDPVSLVRQPSILDLKCLKTLILDKVGVDITDAMIQFGLSRMELELLQFEWNENLSVDYAVKFLRPVKKLVLPNCCEPRFAKHMELLFTQMSSVHCGCRLRSEDRFGFKSVTASKIPPVQGLLRLSLV